MFNLHTVKIVFLEINVLQISVSSKLLDFGDTVEEISLKKRPNREKKGDFTSRSEISHIS